MSEFNIWKEIDVWLDRQGICINSLQKSNLKQKIREFIKLFEDRIEMHISGKCGMTLCEECRKENNDEDVCLEDLKDFLGKLTRKKCRIEQESVK